jgi:hypothetical protein
MTHAYKCDRCGELYEDYEGYIIFAFSNPHPLSGDKQDLCFDCSNTLQSWWNDDVEL